MKILFLMFFLSSLISSVCYCSDPTNYFIRVQITLNNGQVFEGYLPTNIEMGDEFYNGPLPSYIQSLKDRMNYFKNHTDDNYLILLHEAIHRSYEGFDENARSSYFKKRKFTIYQKFYNVTWSTIVEEDDVKTISVTDIKIIEKDEKLPKTMNNAAGLTILKKSEMKLFKSGPPKVVILLTDDSGLSFSKVMFYENFSLSKILSLLFCIENYGSLEYKGLNLNFRSIKEKEKNTKNINSSSLPKEEKMAFLSFCEKTNKLFLNSDHISSGCDKCKHLAGIDELKRKYKVLVFETDED